MKIKLKDWAARNFYPAPCRNTIGAWVREGRIAPSPVFIGRSYWVEDNAKYIADCMEAPKRPDLRRENRKLRLVDRVQLEAEAAKKLQNKK